MYCTQWQHSPFILSPSLISGGIHQWLFSGVFEEICPNLACCVLCLHWWCLASVTHRTHRQTVPGSSCHDFTPPSSGNPSLFSKFWLVSSRIPFCCHLTTAEFLPISLKLCFTCLSLVCWFMLMRVWLTVLSALQNSFLPSLETAERNSNPGIPDVFFTCNG